MQQTLLPPTARGEGLSLPQNTSLNNMAAKGMYTYYPHWLIQTVHVPVLQTLTPPLNVLHFPPQWPRCTTCPMCLVGASRRWPSLSGNPSSEVVCAMLMVWWCGVAALIKPVGILLDYTVHAGLEKVPKYGVQSSKKKSHVTFEPW